MAQHKVYLDELAESGNELVNYAKNDINNKIDELKNLAKSIDWSGPAHDKFIINFNEKLEIVQNLNNKLVLLGEFLTHAHDSYNEANKKVVLSWEKYLDEMGNKNG